MDWARAFAIQACSDFEAREQLLRNRELPLCHQLHYLQMAMEKAAKAHLIAGGADPELLQSSHAYTGKVVPIIVRDGLSRTPGAKAPWLLNTVRALAQRIDRLHPQVNDGGSVPSNCEYPWKNATGRIAVPTQHDFAMNLHAEKAAVTMIKEVRARAVELGQDSLR